MNYDVVIAGGGPAGLSAALALGRGRRRVLLCDAGPRRNAAAVHMHNFVTRDGTPPTEFRRIAREQLAQYPDVEIRDVGIDAITGTRGAFDVRVGAERITARRVLLCNGVIDEVPSIDGFAELWGSAIFQCPYCHGWEIRDDRWAFAALAPDDAPRLAAFAALLRGWTDDVAVFTNGQVQLAADERERLERAGVRVYDSPIVRLTRRDHELTAIELADGTSVARDHLFAHPHQRQTELVAALDLARDDEGYVRSDPMSRETSRPGIYAAGDLATRAQAAVLAAAAGMQAGAAINMDLAGEPADGGRVSDERSNEAQGRYWNDEAGPRWVAMQRDLDAQLEPLGHAVIDALAPAHDARVIDVGCGAGATSLALARRVPAGSVLGCDISQPLLARARERAAGLAHLRFEHADAQTHAFEPATHDAVFSRFGVMFFADPVAAFANLGRALVEGGRLAFVCWRQMADNPSFVLPLTAALPLLPEPPPPPDPTAPGPFAFADGERVHDVLARAGFTAIDVAAHDSEIVFGGRNDLDGAVELALQVGPLARALDGAADQRVRDAVRGAFEPHLGPRGVTLPAATWLVRARWPG